MNGTSAIAEKRLGSGLERALFGSVTSFGWRNITTTLDGRMGRGEM